MRKKLFERRRSEVFQYRHPICQNVMQPVSAQLQIETTYLVPGINRATKISHAKNSSLTPQKTKKMKNDGNCYRIVAKYSMPLRK